MNQNGKNSRQTLQSQDLYDLLQSIHFFVGPESLPVHTKKATNLYTPVHGTKRHVLLHMALDLYGERRHGQKGVPFLCL